MKFFLSLVVLGIFCTDSANSYISPSHLGGTVPWKNNGAKTSFVQPPSDVGLDDIFREEYLAWGNRYGKSTGDEIRFENFKVNFMLQMQHNKKTGTFNLLNEFGDMTAKEFESGKTEDKNDDDNVANNGTSQMATKNTKESSDNVVEVELIIDKVPIPRVRQRDSGSIPRVTPFDSPTSPNYRNVRSSGQRQRPQKVSLDASPAKPRLSDRISAYKRYTRPSAQSSQDDYQQRNPSEPRVYRQDQVINQAPGHQRKKRYVGIGPDVIL